MATLSVAGRVAVNGRTVLRLSNTGRWNLLVSAIARLRSLPAAPIGPPAPRPNDFTLLPVQPAATRDALGPLPDPPEMMSRRLLDQAPRPISSPL